MSVDATPLGMLTADLMERIEDEYGSDAELIDAVLIVEIAHPDPDTDPDDEDLEGADTVEAVVLSGRSTAGLGMMARARLGMVDG